MHVHCFRASSNLEGAIKWYFLVTPSCNSNNVMNGNSACINFFFRSYGTIEHITEYASPSL